MNAAADTFIDAKPSNPAARKIAEQIEKLIRFSVGWAIIFPLILSGNALITEQGLRADNHIFKTVAQQALASDILQTKCKLVSSFSALKYRDMRVNCGKVVREDRMVYLYTISHRWRKPVSPAASHPRPFC